MNDTQLDRLLADASPYTDREVRSVRLSRAEVDLFDEIVGEPRDRTELGLEPLDRGQSASVRLTTIAAAALLVVAGLAVWRLNDTEGSTGSPATDAATTSVPIAATQLLWPPRVMLDDSWTAVYADEDPTSGFGEIQFVRAGDEVSITWGPELTPNPEIYGDGSGPLEERNVTVLGHESLSVDESDVQAGTAVQNSRYRIIVPVEHGTIQIAVSVQRADNLDRVLASIRSVDAATWAAALPARTVIPGERRAAVAQILAGIPLPDGFDAETLGSALVYSDRYQLIVHVIDGVTCAWLDVWFTAEDNDDLVGAQVAADALATSREWRAVLEIAPEGGYADVIWEWADAVNGEGGIATGAGAMPPDRDLAGDALGCVWTDD